MDLNNIVGFKAVDKNGNERQVTVDEMTELVSARIVSAASEISTFAAAAAAGTDEFEDQLPQSDSFSWLRTLDGSKNPTLTSSSAAAKVLGELFTNLKLFPFMRRGILEQNTDFNNITESGIYTYTSLASFTNSPDNDYGILLVFNGSGYLIQEARQVVNTLIIKYRAGVVVDGNFQWTDWKQIQTT